MTFLKKIDIKMLNKKIVVKEIFKSIQGEGPMLGIPQLFIRLSGCNLECIYCDENLKTTSYTPANFFYKYVNDVISISELVDIINPHLNFIHSVSLTGGEPLFQVDALLELISFLKTNNKLIYLETNGTLPFALEKVIDKVDFISMDFKLPHHVHKKEYFEEHKLFLSIANSKECFVKIVLTRELPVSELKIALDIIKHTSPDTLLVLVPNSTNPPEAKSLQTYFKYCLEHLKNVRLIPQMHKYLNFK